MIFVVPALGMVVRDPAAKFRIIPPEGMRVAPSQYWTRRISVGDVTLGSPPDAAPETAPIAAPISDPDTAPKE